MREYLSLAGAHHPVPCLPPSSLWCALVGAETTMEGAEEMTVPGSTAVPVGLRPATHLEMRCVLGESVIL